MQVYRGFDAATSKPTAADRARAPHHLIDVADPRRDYSLAAYVSDAEQAVRDIAERGRIPLVVGGTGLYLRGLLRGIVPLVSRDTALRERLRRAAARWGAPRLHRWLGWLDPASATRLPAGDTQRIVRALEIALSGGETWSERLDRAGTWASGTERFRSLKISLDMDRDPLSRRLNDRVDSFFEAGLIEEVRSLLDRGVPPQANAFKAIGYREVLRAVISGGPLEIDELRREVRVRTRRYAKRQRTWFRKEPRVVWLDGALGSEALAGRIAALWEDRAHRL